MNAGRTVARAVLAGLLAWAGVAGAAPAPAPAAPAHREDFTQDLRSSWIAFKAGDYERAVSGYERIAGRAEDKRTQVRALICLAMIRLLPSSKLHDVEAGRVVLDEIDRRIDKSGLRYEFFGELELLEMVVRQDAELRAERARNGKLRKDLAARDELVRQLRALSVEPH